MTLNERILDFLDGSLPPDDEAELLHTFSVSPEKRELLRSFMSQDALFARDRASLARHQRPVVRARAPVRWVDCGR